MNLRRLDPTPPILVAALVASVALQFVASPQLFYSGDAGIKTLQTKQLARGRLQVDLDLARYPWVREIWAAGRFPFRPPLVYDIDGRSYSAFPFYFPLLSAPGYRALGSRGLLLLPLISLWCLWIGFFLIARRFGLGPGPTAAALAALAFASPVTLYSAVFWEHLPAATVAFLGVGLLFAPEKECPSVAEAITAGALLGAGVWLREELLIIGLLAALIAFLPSTRSPQVTGKVACIGAILMMVALLLTTNRAVYGHFFGAHVLQQLESSGRRSVGLAQTWDRFVEMGWSFFCFFPVALMALLLPLVNDKRARGSAARFLVVALMAAAGIAAIAPNVGGRQWGPRYLLALVPAFAWVVAVVLDGARSPFRRRAVWGAFMALCLPGVFVNAVVGPADLCSAYGRFAPALAYLEQRPETTVVVSSHFIAQELASAFDEKDFFLVKHRKALRSLAAALERQGQSELIFLCNPRHGVCPAPSRLPVRLPVPRADSGLEVELSDFRRLGPVYSFLGRVRRMPRE